MFQNHNMLNSIFSYFVVCYPVVISLYVIIIFYFAIFPSVYQLFRYDEWRYSKGFNGKKILNLSSLSIFFVLVLWWYISVLSQNSTNSDIEYINDLFPSFFLLTVTTASIYFLFHKYSIAIFRLTIKKNTKGEDLLEPKNLNAINDNQSSIVNNYQSNFNTLLNIDNSRSETKIDNSSSNEYTSEINIDISKNETNIDNPVVNIIKKNQSLNPILKNLNEIQLGKILDEFSSTIEIDKNSLNRLFSLFQGYEILERIQIKVFMNKKTKKVDYTPGINFLKKILKLENVINPYTGKEFKATDIAIIVNSFFYFVKNDGETKSEITVQDLFHK